MKFTQKNLEQFSKQIILKNIGINGQKKIFSSKILIVGAGGLGCPLILYLASSGVGNIGVVDYDKIETTNLNRQILFTSEDVGKYKVDQVKKIVKNINKKIIIKTFKTKIKKDNIGNILKNFDIICDGTDNFDSRYLINDYCLKYKKILISAAINKFDGQVFNFNFKKKIPCFRCFVPEKPNNEINCDTDGILPSLAGIAGTLQANEVIKSILDLKNDMPGKILIFNALTYNFRKVKITKNNKCIQICAKRFK